jgi:SAM-dependent methyltransferase
MTTRSKREREQYNAGLQRTLYDKVLKHCNTYTNDDKNKIVLKTISYQGGGKILEIGSATWIDWVENLDISPRSIDCINISEAELNIGKEYCDKNSTINKPSFHLMDAHHLSFENDTFDLVFGGGILHHLELEKALIEINRVLKPNGKIIFSEPLDINPVGKIVRYLTPKARTIDEQPFRFKELQVVKQFFDVEIHTFQFFSVPLGVLSGLLFKNDKNPLTYIGYKLDKIFMFIFPPIRYFYRNMLIVGNKKI